MRRSSSAAYACSCREYAVEADVMRSPYLEELTRTHGCSQIHDVVGKRIRREVLMVLKIYDDEHDVKDNDNKVKGQAYEERVLVMKKLPD